MNAIGTSLKDGIYYHNKSFLRIREVLLQSLSIFVIFKKLLRSESELLSIETPRFNQLVQAKNFALNVDKLKDLGFKQEIDLYSGLQSICN